VAGEGLLVTLGKVGLGIALVVPLTVYLAQDSLIFYRQPTDAARRAQIASRFPAVKEIFLTTADGTRLHAWHLPGQGPTVLYFGGNAEEVSWMLEALAASPSGSWFLMDYRGYGASEGSPSERALVADAKLLYDQVVNTLGADVRRVYAFGRSLGSGVAVALAAERPLAGLVLVTPFDSLAAVAKRYYWYLPVDLMLRHPFDSIGLAPRQRAELLCLISTRDEVIPPVHAERLFEAWGGPKRKVMLQDAGHNTTDSHPLFWPAVRAFLARS
jgi:pimeloyl-ACP methyl ester carboxylesterase